MILSHPFVSLLNFIYQRFDLEGNWIGPKRFKEIIEECWFISKNINTSYTDILQISPMERKYLIDTIKESNRLEKEEFDRVVKESKERAKNRR